MSTKYTLMLVRSLASLAIGCAVVGLAVRTAHPDDALLALMEEEQTVEAAARYPQTLSDAPAHTTVITRDEIEEFGYITLGDVVTDQVGFHVRDDRNYNYMGIRGFAPFGDFGSHVLMMIDGHPMIEPFFSSSFFETNQPVDLRYVQRIEIVRGPASNLYGTNAVLAVINVITRKATDSRPVEVSTSATNDHGADIFASISNVGRRGIQTKISGATTYNRGYDYYFEEFDDPEYDFGRVSELDREATWSAHSHVRKGGWTFSGLVSNREKTVPTASWGTVFNDSRLKTRDLVGFLDSKYEVALGSATRVSARLTYDWYSYDGVWPWEDDDGTVYVFKDPHKGKVVGGELVVSSERWNSHYLITGVATKHVLNATISGYDEEPEYWEYVNIKKSDHVSSAFAQDEISLIPNRLTTLLGVRWDYYERFESVFNPRVALILKSGMGTTKLLYGKSFRAPTLYESYYQDIPEGDESGGWTYANPDLEPEEAHTYEIVHETDIGPLAHATVSAFRYDISDLIQEMEVEDGNLISENVGAVRSEGVELHLRGRLGHRVRWSTGYAWTDSRDEETGESLPVFPANMATVRLAVPLFRSRLHFGLAGRYIGSRLTKSGDELDPVFITAATVLAKRILPHLTLGASVKNLFDAEHLESAGPEHHQETLRQDRRTLVIRATWEL